MINIRPFFFCLLTFSVCYPFSISVTLDHFTEALSMLRETKEKSRWLRKSIAFEQVVLLFSNYCTLFSLPNLGPPLLCSLMLTSSRVFSLTHCRSTPQSLLSLFKLFHRIPPSPRPAGVNGAYQGNGERMFFTSAAQQTSRFRQLADEQLKEKKRRARDSSPKNKHRYYSIVSNSTFQTPHLYLFTDALSCIATTTVNMVHRDRLTLFHLALLSHSSYPLPLFTPRSPSTPLPLLPNPYSTNPSLPPLRIRIASNFRWETFQLDLLHLYDFCSPNAQTTNPLPPLRVPSEWVLLG